MKNNSDLTVQMIVKNEDQWIWYALKSIYTVASEIIVYDTGSVDNTIPIIESFGQEKIRFEKFNLYNSETYGTNYQSYHQFLYLQRRAF